jgi:hypothetical protein
LASIELTDNVRNVIAFNAYDYQADLNEATGLPA